MKLASIPVASADAVWSIHGVEPGDELRIIDASGVWHDAIAASGVEKGHKFPIVWVEATGKGGRKYRLPWPTDAVRPRN